MTENKEIQIKQATPDDIQSIVNIQIESHISGKQQLDKVLNDLFLHEYKKRWQKKLANGIPTFLISVAGKCIGFINYSYQEQAAEIHHIYVIPELRRKQYGKQLCEFVLKKARQQALKNVHVWIVEGRRQIIQFYESLGFQKTALIRTDAITDAFTLTERQYVADLH